MKLANMAVSLLLILHEHLRRLSQNSLIKLVTHSLTWRPDLSAFSMRMYQPIVCIYILYRLPS
jgi:hypothetical protein